jgi:hypothetical protein
MAAAFIRFVRRIGRCRPITPISEKLYDDLDFPPRVQAYLPAPQALPRVPLKMPAVRDKRAIARSLI